MYILLPFILRLEVTRGECLWTPERDPAVYEETDTVHTSRPSCPQHITSGAAPLAPQLRPPLLPNMETWDWAQDFHKSLHCTDSVLKTPGGMCLLNKIMPALVGNTTQLLYVSLWKC